MKKPWIAAILVFGIGLLANLARHARRQAAYAA